MGTSITKKIVTNAMIENVVIEVKVVDVLFLKYVIKKLAEVLSSFFLKYMIEI